MKRPVKPVHGVPAGRATPEAIADALRTQIAHGHLHPGDVLRQEELAARFGVSRIPVREALRRLEESGVVTVHPNRGAFVKIFTDDDVVEVFDLRLLLEVDLLKRAVPGMSAEQLDEIEAARLRADKGAHGRNWSALDSEFHRALYQPAGRARQVAIVMQLRALFQSSAIQESLPAKSAEWLRDHRQIVAACRKGKTLEAVRILADHLQRARETMRARLAVQQRDDSAAPRGTVRGSPLLMKPNCESCGRDLPNGDPDARICSFECTFCASCTDEMFHGVCPNCGGDLVRRPTRPATLLRRHPPSKKRVLKPHPAASRRVRKAASSRK